MCYIGEHVRTVVVDPIQAPVPLPGQEPEIEPSYEPVFDDQPVLVPVYKR